MAMPAVRVRVNRWQREALDRAVRSRDGRIVRRAQVIRLARRGTPVREIAATTGYTEEGVRVLKHRWNDRGEDALRDAPRPGRPPKADGSYRRELRETALTPPAELGYAFGVWTTGRLAEHMTEETGVQLSGDRVRKILHAEGLSWKRPAHTTRNLADPEEHEKARKRLRRLKKGL
jgi:transposase